MHSASPIKKFGRIAAGIATLLVVAPMCSDITGPGSTNDYTLDYVGPMLGRTTANLKFTVVTVGALTTPNVRVLIGEALVNEDERLQARINQLTDKLEAALRQSFRIAQAANGWHGDPQADAAVLIAYVLGRWQLFAKSGFKRLPQEGWPLQRKFLFG